MISMKGWKIALSSLYFMSFAHVLQEYLVDHSRIYVVKLLLEWITDYPGVTNRNGNVYVIDDGFARDLENGKYDVPRNIRTAVAKNAKITIDAPRHFDRVLENIIPQCDNDLYEKLWELIEASDVPTVTVNAWKEIYGKADYSQFLADVFLYAVVQKAPKAAKKGKAQQKEPSADVLSDVDLLNRRIQELVEKVHLKPIRKPPEIAPAEQAFIIPLFHAYESMEEEAKRKRITCKADLSERLKGDLELRRNHFYAAETVRIQGTSALGENGMTAFSDLEDEIRDSVYDVCYDDSYKNGYIRMQNVMRHVSVFQSSKSILSRTGWVGAAENQGICHILAGENRLQWVYDHE